MKIVKHCFSVFLSFIIFLYKGHQFFYSYINDVRTYDKLSVIERLVITMADFRIHRQAMRLETTLQQLIQTSKNSDYETEITQIYDSPIRICTEVLDHVKKNDNLETIAQIKQKYWPYQDMILTQLDEDFCKTLCEDIKGALTDKS